MHHVRGAASAPEEEEWVSVFPMPAGVDLLFLVQHRLDTDLEVEAIAISDLVQEVLLLVLERTCNVWQIHAITIVGFSSPVCQPLAVQRSLQLQQPKALLCEGACDCSILRL